MFSVPEHFRVKHGPMRTDRSAGNNGLFSISPDARKISTGTRLSVIASDGDGWEHVSVSLPKRCPTWPEMCRVKDLFWSVEDCVVQFHPGRDAYINCHPYCLHLWRQIGVQYTTPPTFMIGPPNDRS